MADITCKVSVADLQKIIGSLGKMQAVSAATTYGWTYEVLTDYKNTVTTAMGSVSGKGGSAKMTYASKTESRYWDPLADYTVYQYAGEKHGFGHDASLSADMLRSVFKIWKYTGETAEVVDASLVHAKNFVGVSSAYVEEFRKAKLMEEGSVSDFGTKVPARKLFSVANKLFVAAITDAMNNPNSKLRERLTSEFIQTVVVNGAKWVSK